MHLLFLLAIPVWLGSPRGAGLPPQGRLRLDPQSCAGGGSKVLALPAPAPAWRLWAGDRPEKHARSVQTPCTRAEWAALPGAALVGAIAGSTKECLSELWTYDADTAQVVSAPNVEAVAAEIAARSSNPVAHALPLERLCLFLQIAFYHEFYQAGTDDGPATEQAAKDAMVLLGHRPELQTVRSGMLTLRQQWSVSMDSTNSTVLCLGPLEAMLARFQAEPSLVLVFEESVTVYNLLFSLQRQIYSDWLVGGENSPWFGGVPASLADTVRGLAVDLDPTPQREPLTNNAIWALGYFSFLDPPTARRGQAGVSDAYRLQPTYSGPWLWSVQALERFYAATLDDGTVLDVDALRAEVRAFALPNHDSFEEGKILFETALAPDVVERLYAATMEVTAQFFRKCTFLQPVAGDVHDAVTLVVYASPEDYARFQPFLFGTSTANGGIYLEELATLFTYDRTPSQSFYTLEELLRHEYTHYLDGRFNVAGDFYGPGTLYENGRIDSYVEGLAEYVAGSTRIQGILARRTLLQLVDSDPVRMSVAEILAATYAQGFGFYSYGGLLFAYLEEHEPERFLSIFQAVRGNDPLVFDALEASLAGDAALAADFDAWLSQEIALSQDGQTVFAEDVPTVLAPTGLPVGNGPAILADLQGVLPGGTFQTWVGRYRYSGTLTLPATGLTPGEQRAALDQRMNQVLAALRPEGRNFFSAVAWCGDSVYGGPSATASFAIEGPMGVAGGSSPPGGGGGGGCAGTLARTPGGGAGDPSLPLSLALVFAIALGRVSRARARPAPAAA